MRTRYKLPDQPKNRISLTTQDAMVSFAHEAYKNVDHAAFLKDAGAVLAGGKTELLSFVQVNDSWYLSIANSVMRS